MENPVLEIENLTVSFRLGKDRIRVLNEVGLSVGVSEIVGMVGESGSGKSVTALAISRLLPSEKAIIEAGRILFEGQDVLRLPEKQMSFLRGKKIGFVFQEPMTALNPTMTIGDQLYHVIRRHWHYPSKKAKEMVLRCLTDVTIPRPEITARQYPFELSGGMQQRVVIAMAMMAKPKLLIADEPTTALDVTIQSEILNLIRELSKEHGTSVLFITHDLGIVANLCSRIVVIYAGEIMETGNVREVLYTPGHPYTRALLASLPDIAGPEEELRSIEGDLPDLRQRPQGCVFAPRCSFRTEKCHTRPSLRCVKGQQWAACWLAPAKEGVS